VTILDTQSEKRRVALYYWLAFAAVGAYFAWALFGSAFPLIGGPYTAMYLLPLVIGLSVFVICGVWRKSLGLAIRITAIFYAFLLPILGAIVFITLACAIKGECL
jgi:hypothetical protein